MAISRRESNVKIWDTSGMVVVKCFGILVGVYRGGAARGRLRRFRSFDSRLRRSLTMTG